MATRSHRGIRGTAEDLRLEPGETVLDRLVGDGEARGLVPKSLSGLVAKAPEGQGDMSLEPQSDKSPPPSSSRDKVKVAFYLTPGQREQLDLILAQTRPLVGRAEGRRLDQSALIRAVLGGVIQDFHQHTRDPEQSLLVRWARNGTPA